MCLEPISGKQAGAGLPVAIFVITVLSLIVLSMSQLQESAGSAVSLQIQSQRAFFAAESGAQLVLADIMPANKNDPVSCPASPPIQHSFLASGLRGCNASVECDGTNSPVVVISSTGVCGSGLEEALRTIEVRLR